MYLVLEVIIEKNFNIKCFLIVDFPTSQINIAAALRMFSSHLSGLCTVDASSYRWGSYQLGYYKPKQIYCGGGSALPYKKIEPFIEIPSEIVEYNIDSSNIKWFLNKYQELGAKFKSTINSNGTYQVSLPGEKTSFGYYWSDKVPWLLLHPAGSHKTINILQEFYSSPEGKLFLKEQNNNKLKEYFIDGIPTITQNSKYFTVGDEEKGLIKKFLATDNSLLRIKGVMSSGKSNIISELVKQKPNRTLFITMRKSLSYDMMHKYDTKHYLEHLNKASADKYLIGDSLVIQINSLYKVNVEDFDVFVIDEFESLCLYTQSNINFNIKNLIMLKNIFEHKQLVIADAFLNSFSTELYFSNKAEIFSITNKYKDLSKVQVYESDVTIIDELISEARTKHPEEIITASFTTLSELYAVKSMLEKHDLKIVIVNSETADETKKLIYKLFEEKEHISYDVVLFSPTITVGISIMNNVKHHFHYDTGKSIDPVSSIQMTKRSRLAENIHIYINGIYKNLIFDYNKLETTFKK